MIGHHFIIEGDKIKLSDHGIDGSVNYTYFDRDDFKELKDLIWKIESITMITVKNGLIYHINGDIEKAFGCFEADRIALANDLVYAERFVEKYNGKVLELDSNLKIISEVKE